MNELEEIINNLKHEQSTAQQKFNRTIAKFKKMIEHQEKEIKELMVEFDPSQAANRCQIMI